MKRRGLGRGLDALLASTAPATGAESEPGAPASATVRQVAVEDIRPNPFQPRHHLDEGGLEELAASIKGHGLIQPLLVTPGQDGEGYTLIAGERRWRAAQLAGLRQVPVLVREATEQEMLALAIVENVQRTDLNPIEAAEGYRQLMAAFDLTQAAVADLVGKSRTAVANTVRLLGLPEDVRDLVARGHLTEGHARALLVVSDEATQREVAGQAVAGDWSVRRVEHEVRQLAATARVPTGRERTRTSRTVDKDPDTAAAERALEQALGTRVEIRRRGRRGQVVVHFSSEEDLNAIYDRLVGAT